MQNWRASVSAEEAALRAGGRRHYNAWRGVLRQLRRFEVVKLLQEQYHATDYGVAAAIARQLGVSEATISRDLKAIFATPSEYGVVHCPGCWCASEREKRRR